jgi:hypothetical protein
MSRWTLDGSITINGATQIGALEISRGQSETWITLRGEEGRRHLSLYCLDRRLLFGDAPGVDDSRQHVVESVAHKRPLGCHEENRGHPADNERVLRRLIRLECAVRYARDSLTLEIRGDTLPGEPSRDGFHADRSPWRIQVLMTVPRALVPAVFELGTLEAAHVDRRFMPSG